MAARSYDWLPAQDSSFVMFERRHTHMHVAALALFEAGPLRTASGGLDVERIRGHVAARLVRLARYRQRLAFTPLGRHAIWVDDERFNLHYHVRHTSLPQPGDEPALKALAGRIMSQQLDREKPLWEMWLVEGVDGDRFAMLLKVHHCMVDGIAGLGLLSLLLSPSPRVHRERTEPWVPRPGPGPLRLLLDEGRRRVRVPLAAARTLGSALTAPRRTLTQAAEAADSIRQTLEAGLRRVAATPLNRPIGTHRRVDWQTLDLAAVKEVRKRLDGSVNDVVLTVAAGAVRRFLRRRRWRADRLDYRVVIPVNLRSASDEAQSANRVSAWFLSLPVGERDPLRRFRSIREQTRRLKNSRVAQGTDLFAQFVDWTESTLLTYAGVRLAARLHPYNLIVTNVAGPQVPLYLVGARMQAIYPQLPLFENQGIGVAVMSYLDQVCFGLIGDWDLAADLPAFARDVAGSFEELRAATERTRR